MERGKWDSQRSHGEGQWRRSPDRIRSGPAGQNPGVGHKTGLVGDYN